MNVGVVLGSFVLFAVTAVGCGAAEEARDLEEANPTAPADATATPGQNSGPATVTATSEAKPTSTSTAVPATLTVMESGYASYTNSLGTTVTAWGAILRNESKSQQLTDVQISALFFDASNLLLKTEVDYIAVIFPGQVTAAVGQYVELPGTATRLEIRVNKPKSQAPKNTTAGLAVSGVEYISERFSSKIIGKVTNPFSQDIKSSSIACFAKDANGKMIAFGSSFLELIPSGTTAVAECSIDTRFSIPTGASFELYAGVSSITSFVD